VFTERNSKIAFGQVINPIYEQISISIPSVKTRRINKQALINFYFNRFVCFYVSSFTPQHDPFMLTKTEPIKLKWKLQQLSQRLIVVI